MWVIASTTEIITTALTDTGTILALVVAGVFGTVLALMGAGYVLRLIRRYVLGRKF